MLHSYKNFYKQHVPKLSQVLSILKRLENKQKAILFHRLLFFGILPERVILTLILVLFESVI